MQAAHTPSRKGKPTASHDEVEEKFGRITADHFLVADEIDSAIDGEKAGLVIKCRGSNWLDLYPTKGKFSADAEDAFIDFEGPYKSVDYFYADDSPELTAAAKSRGWIRGSATPGRPETNGVAENAVRQVIEGARTALEHAGLTPKWWSYAGKHFCMSHNLSERNGSSPYSIRHPDAPCGGFKLPFGCWIDFKPSPVRQRQSDPEICPQKRTRTFHRLAPSTWWCL